MSYHSSPTHNNANIPLNTIHTPNSTDNSPSYPTKFSSLDVLIDMPSSNNGTTTRNRKSIHNNIMSTGNNYNHSSVELSAVDGDSDTTELVHDSNDKLEQGTVRSELGNIILLIFLYCLQGIPLGLSLGSIPFLLQSHLSYSELAIFSLCSWPYSCKLLWSPIVDIYYMKSIGQRKSWIIPMQLLIGLILIILSYRINSYIQNNNIYTITLWFILLILFTATQDIAVDGWAVQLLEKSNLLSWCSTCQAIGQNIGFFISYSVFLALNEPNFSNYFRSVSHDTIGLVTLDGFMYYSGILYLLCTIYLLLFKPEPLYIDKHQHTNNQAPPPSILSTYYKIYEICKLPSMQQLIFVLLTSKIAFSVCDNITILKLVEYGLPKQNIAALAFLLFPFELIYPIFVSRYYQDNQSAHKLYLYEIGYPLRQAVGLISVLVVYYIQLQHSEWSYYLFIQIFITQILYSFTTNLMFVNQCSFFAQICDISIGGTYMTLLNTISNLGNAWPKPIVLYLTDLFTCKKDSLDNSFLCHTVLPTDIDGYYILSIGVTVLGAVWYVMMLKHRIVKLGNTDKSNWLLASKQ